MHTRLFKTARNLIHLFASFLPWSWCIRDCIFRPLAPPHLLSVYWMSERESELLAVKGLKPCYLRPGRRIWVSSAPVTGCRLRLRPGARGWGQARAGATTKFQDGLCWALTRPGPFSRISEPQHNLTNNSSAPGVASDHLDQGRKWTALNTTNIFREGNNIETYSKKYVELMC